MTPTRVAPLALGAALALTLTACSDESAGRQPSATPATTSAGGGDVDRYCELTAELEALGEQIFADVPEDAPLEEHMRREQQLLDQASVQLDELAEVAPDEIRADVLVFLDDMRARAATGQQPDAEAALAAEDRILAFEEEHCRP
ncbi:hypothetical protein [Blastococcus deserti]|uniref:Uncharacterized protein n=1 Tax=Blastococcus deserti TaxID=2259033 RepID=A0ABW4XBS9_9ACTN